jgi:hypothetical protein
MEILLQIAEPVAAVGCATVGLEELGAFLPHLAQVAEALERRRACGDGIHSARDVVADALVEMKCQLVLDLDFRIRVERAPAPLAGERVAHDHLAHSGATVVPIAWLTAAANRCQPEV